MSGSPAAPLDWRGELLLRAWELEQRAQTAAVLALLEGLPRERLLDEPELGILLLNAYVFTFRRDLAWELQRELLPVFHGRGNDRLHRRYLNFRGVLLLRDTQFAEAEELFRQLEWMSGSARDDLTLSFAWANLGHLSASRLHCAEALVHYSRALVLARAQQGARGMARILWGAAYTYAELGMYPESARDYASARRYQANPHERACIEIDEALMLAKSGRLDAAFRLASRARAFLVDRHVLLPVTEASTVLARIAAARGDLQLARHELAYARSTDPANELTTTAQILEEVAALAILEGDQAARVDAEERAAALFLAAGTPLREARMRARLALVDSEKRV